MFASTVNENLGAKQGDKRQVCPASLASPKLSANLVTHACTSATARRRSTDPSGGKATAKAST